MAIQWVPVEYSEEEHRRYLADKLEAKRYSELQRAITTSSINASDAVNYYGAYFSNFAAMYERGIIQSIDLNNARGRSLLTAAEAAFIRAAVGSQENPAGYIADLEHDHLWGEWESDGNGGQQHTCQLCGLTAGPVEEEEGDSGPYLVDVEG